MLGRHWRGLRRWLHDRYGTHTPVFDAKYGRCCDRCFLPLRWDATTGSYILRTPFEMHPPVNRKRISV
jgi:hypothetical protein